MSLFGRKKKSPVAPPPTPIEEVKQEVDISALGTPSSNNSYDGPNTDLFYRVATYYIHCPVAEVKADYSSEPGSTGRFLGKGSCGYVFFDGKIGRKEMAIKVIPVVRGQTGKFDETYRSIHAPQERDNIQKIIKSPKYTKSKYVVQYQGTQVISYFDSSNRVACFDYVTYVEKLIPLVRTAQYKNCTFTVEQIIQITDNIAQAIKLLHHFKPTPMMHRDINPKNIFYDPDTGTYKLGDFDSSKLTKDLRATTVCGTPGYIDPQSYIAEAEGRDYTVLHDLYAYGKTILELFRHIPEYQQLFEKLYATRAYKYTNETGRENLILTEIVAKINPALAGIIAKTTERDDISIRYKSIDEIIADLPTLA